MAEDNLEDMSETVPQSGICLRHGFRIYSGISDKIKLPQKNVSINKEGGGEH